MNDSIQNNTHILHTDEDLLILEDEDHLQSHHVTTNLKNSNLNFQE